MTICIQQNDLATSWIYEKTAEKYLVQYIPLPPPPFVCPRDNAPKYIYKRSPWRIQKINNVSTQAAPLVTKYPECVVFRRIVFKVQI